MKTTHYWKLLCLVTGALIGAQFASSAATIKNRWSFNEGEGTVANDSVGGKHGTLVNAYFTTDEDRGVVYLPNGDCENWVLSSDPNCAYVAFPPNIVTGYTSIAIEAWVRPTLCWQAYVDWQRLWDFGNSDGTNGVPGYFFFRAGSTSWGAGGDITVPGPNTQTFYPAGCFLTEQAWNHVVWCSDGASGKVRIYVNGQVFARDGFTNTPALSGPTTNNWLGRSQFGADKGLTAYYDEFRIYEGVLSPLEIAANYQNGPGAFPPNYGTVTSLVLRVASPIPVNASRPAEVLAGASGLTNTAVDVREMAGVVYTSSNTNVVQVSPDGIVTAKFPGKAIVTAILGSISATQEVEVVEAPTRLAHRYSFDAEGGYVAYDSVGGRHGTLQGGAVQTGGKVILNGAAGTYVELPPYLLHPTNIQNGAVTFVAWITAYPQNAAWTRLFDFGRREGGAGARYIFFAPNNAVNGGSARLAVSDSSPGWQSEDGFNVSHVLGRTNLCVMAVWNPNPTRRFLGLYLDGTLVGSMTTTKPFSAVDNQLSFLGQSLYTADGWFNGEIHEFRIYDGELDRIQLAAVYQAGANNTNFAVGNMVSMILDVRSPTILLSQVRQISCVINFQYVTNINLIGDPNLTLRTSDTNVLSVTSGGLLRAHRLGTATLTAEYRYVTKQATNVYTVSTNITVILQPCTLAHRYSFNEGSGLIVYDLVGSAHGQIKAGTNTLGVTNFVWAPAGQLTINTNTALGAQDTYVELPAGILTGMGSDDVSFEFWATPLSGAAYQRVFDFGSVPGSPTNAAEPNVFFARGPWWAATTPYYDWVNGSLSAGAVWPNGTPAHFVIVHSGTEGTAMIYRDGVLVATSTTQNLPIRSINDIYCFIGRSLYSWPMSKPGGWFDPYWVGSFNEFRMYKGLLTDAEVARHYALGPDQVIANVPLSYAREGNNLVLSWPKYAVHFVLESSPVIGPGATWTPVSGTLIDTGTELRMTVPITGSAQYFRLRR